MADVFADSIQTGTAEELSTVGDLVERASDMAAEVASMELALKEQKATLHKMLTNDLPEAMDTANCREFKTADGLTVTLKDVVSAAIPAGKRVEAFAWLAKQGHGDLIVHEWKLSLKRGTPPAVIEAMRDSLKGKDASEKESVHPQTLSAFCREQLSAGNELPEELLGLYTGRIAKIKTEG